MLFLFRGKYGPAVRAILGVLLLVVGVVGVVGVVVHGGAILIAIGAALIVWSGIGAFNGQRARRQARAEYRSRVS